MMMPKKAKAIKLKNLNNNLKVDEGLKKNEINNLKIAFLREFNKKTKINCIVIKF